MQLVGADAAASTRSRRRTRSATRSPRCASPIPMQRPSLLKAPITTVLDISGPHQSNATQRLPATPRWSPLQTPRSAQSMCSPQTSAVRRADIAKAVALPDMSDSIIVKVKPGSRKGPLVEVGPDGELTIYVRERAVDGKANDAVTRLLAAHLQLPRSRVELESGATSRLKRFRVSR